MQFTDVQKIDNGARFLNADLHIHSFGGSSDVRDATMTPEAIVDSAVKQGLSVIAITDHNSNKNVQKAIDHARERYNGQLLVMAGVEVTTAHGHLLVYFPPDGAAALAKFLSRLDLVGEMGEDNTRTAKSMSDVIKEAHALGGISVAAHIDREKTGFDKFAPGFQNWKRDILTSPGLYGLECDAADTLTWYSDQDNTEADGTERTKIFLARQEVQELQPRHHLAHVQGSDAHSLAKFEQRDPTKPWTRIKLSELTFEAFRLALIDPTARIRACGSIPLSVPRIRGVAMTGGFLHEEVIHFSDNLNSFIGGRGTGKSTAIRAVAYAFGLIDDFGEYDNCPDSVTVYCEDASGVFYRYVRTRGGEIEVKAKADGSISDVPIDSFHIEYFGQGELAKIAEDPLKTPQLFQDFLDRHTTLRDLIESEETLVSQLRENAGKLQPIESSFGQVANKKKTLEDVKTKLKIAEEGNLKEIIRKQSQLASEKAIRENIEETVTAYNTGWNLASVKRDFDTLLETAGECTDDTASQKTIQDIKAAFEKSNQEITALETSLNSIAKTCASSLTKLATELKISHQRISGEIAAKIAELKAKGQATDLPGLQALLKQKTTLANEIATVERRTQERDELRKERTRLRTALAETRQSMTQRRKDQLKGINRNLSSTIKDYTVFVRYDDAGITDAFEGFMQSAMHGTYLQDTTIQAVCSSVTPSELADMVLSKNSKQLAAKAKISPEWATEIVEQLCYWGKIFELQALSKPPKPIITVLTKSEPPRRIPVFQLSDGQRHTILLTIAMLAESNVPLIIDQPEDDLDNAFIFSSIVATLRAIKERRQVILVTHNANIAVLGDSELILPMWRENDCGKAKDRGSIDSEATKVCVQNILEGGLAAFLRRKEIYGY
jgi:PHP family Zn ribbon phosphoesterase